MRKKLINAVSIFMSLCMIAPATVFTSQSTYAEDKIGTETKENQDEELKIQGDYFRQYMSVLLDEGKLKSDSNTTSMAKDEKSKSVIFSDTKENIINKGIVLDKTLNFDGSKVDRISIDGLAEKGTTVKIGVFLDGSADPIATTTLYKQRKKNNWTYSKDISIDVADKNIVGQHTVQIKVLDASSNAVTFSLKSIEFVESTVPTVYFNIDESEGTIAEMNASEDHSAECYGSMTIKVPDGFKSEYTGKNAKGGTYQMEYIRGRGNSTWSVDKKPYKIKLDKKADILGMGKNKHWVLLANYYDNSLLRNKITYWLGSKLNMPFTPKSEPVDVVMNGEYYGSYMLCEQVRVGSTRVNIDDLEDNEDAMHATEEPFITGGYLLSLEPYGNEEKKSFKTSKGNTFLIESPSFEDYYNETQYNYIKNYVQKVEDAIYGSGYKGSDGVSYKDLMDVASTVYYYWIQEFSMNGDGYASTSTYLYKPRNGKLYWGPLWDFDYVAWGSTEYDENCIKGWTQNDKVWLDKLFEDRTFAQEIVNTWSELKAALEELVKDGGQLDIYKKRVEKSAAYNFEKWGMSPLNYDNEKEGETNLTYDQEIERLRGWIKERMDWVDKNVNSLVPTPCTVKYVADGKTIATSTEYIGKKIHNFPKVPKKKGYVFTGWQVKYHLTYDEYIALYPDVLEQDDKDTKELLEQIKKNGYDYEGDFDKYEIVPKSMTLTANYVSEKEIVQPKKLYLNKSNINISYDSEGSRLIASVLPFDATYADLEWKSSDESVVTVDDGSLSVQGQGDAVITVSTENGLKASCKVHVCTNDEVDKFPYDTYDMSDSEITLNVGEYKKLNVQSTEEQAIYTGFPTFMSVDSSIADINDGGYVYGVSEGKTAVLMVSDYGVMPCTVNVVDPNKVKKGKIYKVKGNKYKVTSVGKNKTVTFIGTTNKKAKTVIIPNSVKINKYTFKVTAVGNKALYNYKNLTNLKVGKNVKKLTKKMFKNNKKLKKVVLKSRKTKVQKGTFSKKVKISKPKKAKKVKFSKSKKAKKSK